MGMVANKKTIYLADIMGFRALVCNGDSGFVEQRLR